MTHALRRLTLIAGTVAMATLATACGATRESGSASTGSAVMPAATRTVDIAMEDIKFDQTALTVDAGETIDFRFSNTGQIAHDAFVGDVAAQMEHEDEMTHAGDASSHSMGEAAITVQPGAAGELTFTFTQPGTYEVGCHQPGHYAAGMKIAITVQ